MDAMTMGRPRKDTEATVALIMLALSKGMTRKGAAAAAGIAYGTMAQWAHDNPEFAEALTRAEASAEPVYVDTLYKAATEGRVTEFYDKDGNLLRRTTEYDWRAAAWLLERRNHEAYGNREKVDLTVRVREAASRLAQELGIDDSLVQSQVESLLGGKR